jgi:hypothetical protein
VAIWDHLLAHGTALGVAHGVVQSLPLGAESEREAWSSVGGRWRVVRVRYPRSIPPMYGYHPALVLFCGLLLVFVGLPMLGYLIPAFGDLLEAIREGSTTDFGTELPRGLATPLAIIGPVVAIGLGLVSVVGGWMALAGFADLVTGRTTIEGRVLRVRERAKQDNKVVCHVAVDDGTTDKLRAWRFRRYTVAYRGATVRGRATRFLRHVRDLEVVKTPSGEVPAPAGVTQPEPQPVGQAAPALPFGLGGRQGTSLAAAAMAAVEALTAAAAQGRGPGPAPGGPQAGAPGTPPAGSPGGAPAGAADPAAALPPTPALPDDAAVSAAAGMAFARDPGAKPHPAALAGGSAVYRTGRKGHVQVVWVPPVTIDVYRRLPTALRHEIPGLGQEGYRARFGGGVMARRGPYVVMVTPHLPGVDGALRDDVAARVAAAALAVAPAGPPAGSGQSGPPPAPGDAAPAPAGPAGPAGVPGPSGTETPAPAGLGAPGPPPTSPTPPAPAPGPLPPPPPPRRL